jgi:hypothetical protein
LKNLLDSKIRSIHAEIVNQIVYVGVNIATGNRQQKELVMGSKTFMSQLLNIIQPNYHKDTLIGALWVVINLAWTEDQGFNDRIVVLQNMGFEQAIASLKNTGDADIRERVEAALKYISPQ